jgi:hypothetical protein
MQIVEFVALCAESAETSGSSRGFQRFPPVASQAPFALERAESRSRRRQSQMFGHSPGGRPEWTLTQDPAFESVGSRCPSLG